MTGTTVKKDACYKVNTDVDKTELTDDNGYAECLDVARQKEATIFGGPSIQSSLIRAGMFNDTCYWSKVTTDSPYGTGATQWDKNGSASSNKCETHTCSGSTTEKCGGTDSDGEWVSFLRFSYTLITLSATTWAGS